jgi:hypothetical protein
MNLLTGLDRLIADIAGPLMFSPALLIRKARVADTRGGFVETETASDCQALVIDYTATARAQIGIPDTDRNIMILGHGLSVPPIPGNVIAIDGYRWVVIQTTRDPAKAVYECQARPDGVYILPLTGLFSSEFSSEFA